MRKTFQERSEEYKERYDNPIYTVKDALDKAEEGGKGIALKRFKGLQASAVRELLRSYEKQEISFMRFVDLLNDKVRE